MSVPPPRSLMPCWWRENSPLPAPGDESAHSPQAPTTAFWVCLFVQEKTGAGGEKAASLGRLLLQRKDGKRLHGASPAPRMTAGVGKTKPGSFSHCFPALCYVPRSRSAASPLGLLSWLIPPWLSLQQGPGASDLHPSSPKTSSSTKPSPRQRRKRNLPNAALHLVCALLPVPSGRRAAGFRSR